MWKKKLMAVALLCGASLANAYMPQAGTWVVTSELDGKPGRGLAIDVQNDTLLMQMYAYEASGKATFYLAVGTLTDSRTTTTLTTYTGGRHFGSGAQSGVATGSPGNVSIRFTSGTTGFITFPNEPEKAISRFNFGYPFQPSSLKGFWVFNSIGSEGAQTDVVELTTVASATSTGNGLTVSRDGLFGCEHQTSGNLAGSVLCVKVNSAGTLLRAYALQYSVNEGEGYSQRSSTSTQQMLLVRRLTTAQGIGTGILWKSEGAPQPEHPALRELVNSIATTGALP
jgi:hypothetical protein